MRRLSASQARRVAITAQGLAAPRPSVKPDLGHLLRTVRRVGVLQIDSVNVLERAHHLTLFSRLGPYDQGLLWRALEEHRLFEYWARMASFAPVEDFPFFRHRMDRFAEGNWNRVQELDDRAPGYIESVYRQVAERGPLTASELEEPGERSGPWWGWADGKIALEYLLAAGRVLVAYRRNFTRYYDIVERVIPSPYRDGEAPSPEAAQRALLLKAATALGVGTARDLMGYYSIKGAEGRRALAALLEGGSLVEVQVEGWAEPAYMPTGIPVPRSIESRSLVNPFDPYMWNRDRIERLHGFEYRIEIYVPQPKRVYGYFVLPFLLGDHLVARVDLKADRQGGRLRVPGAFLEAGADSVHVAGELAIELHELAGWLELDEISVGDRGELAPALRKAV
ncbi:MAG TPA: crosslink repair DNA glycosylase YcaQ family protein [Acidimicrobiia bacterium]|nr:crosslink repair DNA glycosylase YcaQ family protein [Acidimicrobiia bacterium]